MHKRTSFPTHAKASRNLLNAIESLLYAMRGVYRHLEWVRAKEVIIDFSGENRTARLSIKDRPKGLLIQTKEQKWSVSPEETIPEKEIVAILVHELKPTAATKNALARHLNAHADRFNLCGNIEPEDDGFSIVLTELTYGQTYFILEQLACLKT